MSFWSIDRRQAGVLADRYFDVMLGDPRGLILMLIQAPLIGVLIAGVWDNVHAETPTLYFVLCLSAFFLGAINASREVVKERALFLRERMYNLDVGAYVLSKYLIQTILMVIACAVLTGIVQAYVPLTISVLAVGLTLVLTALAGTAVGLLISAAVRSSDKAVMTVPLVVIPQILFSKFVLQGSEFHNWTGWIQSGMPVHHSMRLIDALLANETSVLEVAGALGVLLVIVGVCYALTYGLLSSARY